MTRSNSTPNYHNRKKIRLPDYDYSQNGAYFVTICTRNKECLLGKIKNEKMDYNSFGNMIEKWWRKLPENFQNVRLDQLVVMPNHFHGIIIMVGADPCVGPKKEGASGNRRTPLQKIIQWFKTMTTNEYLNEMKNNNRIDLPQKLWQRSYYDHIIRNEKDLLAIREYIINNPLKWYLDDENPDHS